LALLVLLPRLHQLQLLCKSLIPSLLLISRTLPVSVLLSTICNFAPLHTGKLRKLELKDLNPKTIKELSSGDTDDARVRARTEAYGLDIAPDGAVPADGGCLDGSVALSLHTGSLADWNTNRTTLTNAVRKKICDFLENNEPTNIPGVSCVLLITRFACVQRLAPVNCVVCRRTFLSPRSTFRARPGRRWSGISGASGTNRGLTDPRCTACRSSSKCACLCCFPVLRPTATWCWSPPCPPTGLPSYWSTGRSSTLHH
jgi:hypothetical protein